MPEASTEFGKITDSAKHLADHLEHVQHSAEHTSTSVATIVKGLLAANVTTQALNVLTTQMPLVQSYKEALVTLGKTGQQLREIHETDLKSAEKALKSGEITKLQADQIAEKVRLRYPLLMAQLELEKEINKVGAVRLGILALAVTYAVQSVRASNQLNDSLIKANTAWGIRYGLVQSNYAVQRQLGVSFGTIIEAQRALVNYGVQNNRAYTETLKTVVELHEGLGMSIQSASELAVITEKQIKTSFQDTADVVAQLVQDTSLTADEVERIAKTLGPLIYAIQPKGAPAFPQIAQALGQYEDAIKRVGGMGDEFTQMIANMMKPEGLMQAGILGITDPQKLLGGSGIKEAMEAFRRTTDQMLGDSVGTERIFRMQALAVQFNKSYEQMSLMVDAVHDVNSEIGKQITAEERFRQQMAEAGKSFGQIYKSIVTLIQQALSPLAVVISATGKAINDWIIQPLMKWKPFLIVAWSAVWVGIIAVIVQLRRAFVAFMEVAGAAKVAASQLRQYVAAQVAQSTVGNVAGRGAAFQLESEVAKNAVPSIKGAFTGVAKDFKETLRQQKTSWTVPFAELFRSAPKQNEFDFAKNMVPWYKQLLSFSKESFSSTKGFFTNLLKGSNTQITLLASINTRLLLMGVWVKGALIGTLVPILEGIAAVVAFFLSPIGILVIAVGVLVTIIALKLIKILTELHLLNESTKHNNLRIADMGNRLLDQQKTRIYLEARAGNKEQVDRIYKRMMLDLDKGIGVGENKSVAERAKMKAELSAYVEKEIALAQYTKSQFGDMHVTPAQREEQAKEDLEFQQKIAENTKKLNEGAKKAQEEENRRAEAERQERELRYLRDGGAVGRYNWGLP